MVKVNLISFLTHLVLAWDRYTNMSGLNQLMEFQPSPLDYWSSNGNMDIGRKWINFFYFFFN